MGSARIAWLRPDDPADAFPPLDQALAEPDGLLAAGGDLSTGRLLYAYRHGIFPWYDDGQPLLWWSPHRRCVLRAGDFHVSRRLRRQLRNSTAEIRFDTAFAEVIRRCAAPRASYRGTWITADMIAAYERLHAEGWAHSIEVWRGGGLVGGLYGLAIGRVFFGESMFSGESNASKFALLTLARMLDEGELALVDCQVVSAHLTSLGATLMRRDDYIAVLEQHCTPPISVENWPRAPIPASSLA